jgi:hypothetical protein
MPPVPLVLLIYHIVVMEKSKILFSLGLVLLAGSAYAQQRTVSYDLLRMLVNNQLTIVNREVSPLVSEQRNGIMLSAKPDDGVAWLNGVDFANGTIELDIYGKDVLQQSFLGVAFHGSDARAFDAVYFRPFNFKAADSVRKIHAVQYESNPLYPWNILREKYNGQYEKNIIPPPDPNKWFHVKIVVNYPSIAVFVNGNNQPSLSIKQLNDRKTGKLGLWVGNNSDGAFANLKVTFLN